MNIHVPAKINLYLNITGRRPSGFHNLITVFQTINLFDDLTWAPGKSQKFTLQINRADLGNPADNLVTRAAALFARALGLHLDRDFQGIFSLNKAIPHGGGLGGGSSDAAGTLKLLNEWKGFPLDEPRLMELALELGSDVPFFLKGGTCLGMGRGDILAPLKLPENIPHGGFLFFPGITCKTPRVFAEFARNRPEVWDDGYAETLSHPWGRNHLEGPARNAYPALDEFAHKIHSSLDGLFFMTGSGSTWVWLTHSLRAPEIPGISPHQIVRFQFY
jgi:4-diphosphocytidyl-2-C-methyl-D-erythritol kinase